MFEQVFLRLRQLLPSLILVEPVAPTGDTSRLNRQDKVIIILTIKERHQALLPLESLINEQILLIMAHRIAQVHIIHLPSVALRLAESNAAMMIFSYDSAVRDGWPMFFLQIIVHIKL